MRVRIEAPSSPFAIEKLAVGVARLRAAGWTVQEPSLRGRHAYLNGTDAERRRALEDALHADVDVVWLARGGYGLTRLTARLQVPAGRAPTVIGFSDATALFGRLAGSGVPCVHGPLATTIGTEPDDSFAHTLAVLERRARGHVFGGLRGVGNIDVTGPLFAANLCVLTHLIGTTAQPELSGAVLVVEEVGERPYRIDRMLTQLVDSGALDGVRAVIVGQLTQCDEPPSSSGLRDAAPAPLDVFRERLGAVGVPVVSGLSVGHETPNWALPLGTAVRLRGSGASTQLELLEDLP